MAASSAAGAVYRAAAAMLSARPPVPGWGPRPLPGWVLATVVTMTVGLAMAGLVLAADAGTGRQTWLRRVLDGSVVAGCVLMAGWFPLRETRDVWRLQTGMIGVLWTAEVAFLGFLFALRRLVRIDQRATLGVAVVGLSLTLIGDTLRLWTVGPYTAEVLPSESADACNTVGLLVIAAGPWVPGGASVLGAARLVLRMGMEGAAAFIPLTVCTVTALHYALAPLGRDPVPLLVGATVVLGLWARQTFLPSENREPDD
jgi:hypothetical protein